MTWSLKLGDVTRGLIYMHDQGVIHGGLRGVRFRDPLSQSCTQLTGHKANILVNHSGHACLAGFGQVTVVSNQPITTPSTVTGDAIQWMSPELIDPRNVNLEESRPTTRSDCYALGMVIYEVLSEKAPFAPIEGTAVISKIVDGGRPVKPRGREGTRFTEGLWRMLEDCWKPQPDDRPSLDTVLGYLQDGGKPSAPPRRGRTITFLHKAFNFTAGKPHGS